jgi:nicotinamide phosphoribosyltransferase
MKDTTILRSADSYKYSHFMQYPKGTTNINAYIESRGISSRANLPITTEIVFFGLQAFIKKYLMNPISLAEIGRVERMMKAHGEPFNRAGWVDILNKFNGYLPIEIEALPEGTVTKPGTVLVQVRATHPDFAWVVSFVETALLRAIWYPSTVATLSREIKKVIAGYVTDTSDAPETLAFKLHDFGQRGVSSSESAGIGGLAHLINFSGTDTVEALFAAEEYYNVVGPVAFSIPASEHSTMTSWGRENEFDAYENMIDLYGGKDKMFACVSDSYDIFNAVENGWGGRLKEKVLSMGGTVVIRPDSGDPVTTAVSVVDRLAAIFGTTTNKKGYRVLHPSVRVIQGDGINMVTINAILWQLKNKGYSADNIAFGMGGALLQQVNRDTLMFAMKTSAVQINEGEWIDVYKDPVGADFKKSKKGILKAVPDGLGGITTHSIDSHAPNLLQRVWSTGTMLKETTFEEIRKKAAIN